MPAATKAKKRGRPVTQQGHGERLHLYLSSRRLGLVRNAASRSSLTVPDLIYELIDALAKPEATGEADPWMCSCGAKNFGGDRCRRCMDKR